uniref:Vacuolar protein sorting-associated protein 54 n=1 Tax=Heterorhabditis bacteriophora TaxID=37862 RepID=A0A1I7XLJ9_HETBA
MSISSPQCEIKNLSSVLSDPSRSRSEVNTFFTRHWGDAFIPPTTISPSHFIPPVTAQQFTNYVKNTAQTYKRYRASKKAVLRLQSPSENKMDAEDIPLIFVDPSFLLSHGPTFTTIFLVPERNDDPLLATRCGKTISALEVNDNDKQIPGSFRDYKSLHSRLESIHDVVDSRLAAKLVSKSTAFWQMVHSYGSLHEELISAMNHIIKVRSSLKIVSTQICERINKITKLYELRERKKKLLVKLHDISCLRDAQSTVQMMLNQSDYPKAIECIETSREVLTSELSGLKELYEVIGRMMLDEFASLIQKEFGTRPEEGTLITFEGELSSVIMGLMQVRKYSFTNVLRSEIVESLKGIMRHIVKARIVESGLDITSFDPTLNQLGDSVRRMKSDDWLKTIEDVTSALFAFCQRTQDIAVPSTDPASLLAVEIRSDVHLRKIISLIAEFAHQSAQTRLCRLLVARSKDATQDTTTPSQLAQVLSLVRSYQAKCAEQGWNRIQGPVYPYREVLDKELWKATEVPAVFQSMVDACIESGRLRNEIFSGSGTKGLLLVNGTQFVVVSRCCQLILGAGALQLVGLKTISVRNLALASRSLQLIVHFVPIVAGEAELHLRDDQKHLMRHFKQVISDYLDHISEITAKLISVIDRHTLNCLSTWEIKGSVPSLAFQQLCRQMHKFHSGLTGIMPDEQIKALFETVHSHFKVNLKMQLATIGISPHDSLTYGFVTQDYAFYTQSIHSMSCCADMTIESLNDIMYGR